MIRVQARRSIITTLGRWIGLSTLLSLIVFAATAAIVVLVVEQQEQEEEEQAGGEVEEDPLDEAIAEVGLAMLVAAPLGVGLAVAGARWIARRTVHRVTAVSDMAAQMTADNLGERLPVSPADDELDALAVALNGLFTRVEAGVALQRQFAADASHELRSPLAVLSSTLEVARRRPRASEEWEGVVDRALREARHMTRLVEALLQLTRAGAAERLEVVDADALVTAVIDRFEPIAADAGVQLRSSSAAGLAVRVDAELMCVALGNLVSNAICHAPVGSVVGVAAFVDGGEVCLRVTDQGPGVPLHERERIFNPFVRGSVASADRGGLRVGLGLGLAITRRVVEGHGARIHVEDGPDGGAVFTVHIPRGVAAGDVC